MENLGVNEVKVLLDDSFWKGKKVLITGHTGFKGSWLSMWLNRLGAKVIGYALSPPTENNLFELCNLEEVSRTVFGDIRDYEKLYKLMLEANPDIVIHMAAQPLVKNSYHNPLDTYEINIMGTVNLLEAVRKVTEEKKTIKAVINVTSDKCYENKEWERGYRETDRLGGYDPYSNSKACSEFVTASYRDSFFNPKTYSMHGVALASARAGNVIGGGDFSSNRLVPDCIRALLKNEVIVIRNPRSIRPWQHVLEPLSGYLLLAQKLYQEGTVFAGSWNFGPLEQDTREVEWVVNRICQKWGHSVSFEVDNSNSVHEARNLKLDCSKANRELGWIPNWSLEHAIDKVLEWTKAYKEQQSLQDLCLKQIEDYMLGI
jgi:CDP-glucose 4,6-dehydratase